MARLSRRIAGSLCSARLVAVDGRHHYYRQHPSEQNVDDEMLGVYTSVNAMISTYAARSDRHLRETRSTGTPPRPAVSPACNDGMAATRFTLA